VKYDGQKLSLFFSLSLLTALSSSPASAQEPRQENLKSDDSKVFKISPIVVEARQWREDIQKTPASIDVLSKEELQSPLWNEFESLSKKSANILVEQSSVQTRIVIRGTTGANTGLQDPVGYFVNDVALPHGALQAPKLFDLERLEIIKGPQSALYGRNTEAGAIKTITANPDWSPTAETSLNTIFLDGPGGWEPNYVLTGRLSSKLVEDKAAGSVALRLEKGDGVHYNRFDNTESGGDIGRWTLSTGADIFIGEKTDISFKTVIEGHDFGKQRMRYLDGAFTTPRYETNYNTDSWEETLTGVHSLKIDHSLDNMLLTSITGLTHYNRDFQLDLDTGPLPTLPTLLSHDDQSISQELRLQSDGPEGGIRWLAGIYGFSEWTDIDFKIGVPRTERKTDINQQGLAVFGHADFPLTEKLTLNLGSRLEWHRQDGRLTHTALGTTNRFDDVLNTVTFLPKATLSYQFLPSTMLYASYARGYLPGGINYGMASSQETLSYDPEYSWTSEIGLKTGTVDNRWALQASLFHTSTRDKQIVDLQPGGIRAISNASETRVFGAELSANANLTENWEIFGSLGLQRAEATDYQIILPAPADLSGNRLPMASDYTYGLGVRYNSKAGWFGETSINGAGSHYFDSQNSIKQSAFLKLDAAIGYRLQAAELSLWATNITNENVFSRAVATPNGTVVEDGAPRRVGLSVKYKW